jgi:hypothetical protein
MGFVKRGEFEALKEEVARLRMSPSPKATVKKTPAKKTTVKKTSVKKTASKKASK